MKAYALLGFARFFRDELLPAQYRTYRLSLLLPDWTVPTWIALAFGIAFVALLKGAYSRNKAQEKAQQEKHPVHLPSGEPYAGVIERGIGDWIVPLLVVAGIIGLWTYGRVWGRSPTVLPVDADSSVFIACSIDFLPIRIAPMSALNIMRVNASIPPPRFGFYEINNRDSREVPWPDAALISQAFAGKHIYKCELSNHSHALQDLTIRFAIDFTAQAKDGSWEYKADHTITINPLDSGSVFVFYLVNECQAQATIILPVLGIAQLPGQGLRQIPLRRLNRLPVGLESLITLFPSDIAWTTQPVCKTTKPR